MTGKKLIAGCCIAGAAILLAGACSPQPDGRNAVLVEEVYMKNKWFVSSTPIPIGTGERIMMYQAQRIKDTSAVDHSGNREYAGTLYRDKADAQAVADEMNAKEAE